MTRLWHLFFGICLMAAASCAGGPPAAPDLRTPMRLELRGSLGGADHQTYREVGFDVPPGIERLTVSLRYSGRAERTTVDLGLIGPNGFRGWSGGNKSEVTISSWDATPSYLPGPIEAGRWSILLGVPNIRAGSVSDFVIDVSLEPASVAAPGPVLSQAQDWYRGDFHSHTGHSDGTCESLEGMRVPCPVHLTIEGALDAGLDFIAITDHNTTSGAAELRSLQPYYDSVLLVPGREVTTFWGHANVFGATSFFDFRLGSAAVPDANALARLARDAGGLFSINHPNAPSGELCMGCGWVAAGPDAKLLDAIEVVNGGTMRTVGSAESAMNHILFWEDLLDRGYRVTAIAGSDNHDPTSSGTSQSPVGAPATLVFAQSLSTAAILEGVRNGRVAIDLGAGPGARLDLSASAGDSTAKMGSVLAAEPGQKIKILIDIAGVSDGQVEIVLGRTGGGRTVHLVPIDDPSITVDLDPPGGGGWVRANIRRPDGSLLMISNPVYLDVAGSRGSTTENREEALGK